MSKNISMVLICYNQENYIVEAMDGIRNQTIPPYEIIIADDASKDGTQDVIRNYVQTHGLHHWKLLLSHQNRGITGNLQQGIDASSGDIIIAMAGDDISLPNRCAITAELFEKNPHVNIIANSGFIINSNGAITGEKNEEDGALVNDVVGVIRFGFPGVHPVGQAFRRTIFSRYGSLPFDVPNEDDQLSFRGIVDGGILKSAVKTYKYRVHERSASAWIRNKQSNDEFYQRFSEDMVVRQRHVKHWIACVQVAPLESKAYLLLLLERKMDLYAIFSGQSPLGIFGRVAFLLKNNKIICLREKVYLLFGKYGVLGWRKARHVFGKV